MIVKRSSRMGFSFTKLQFPMKSIFFSLLLLFSLPGIAQELVLMDSTLAMVFAPGDYPFSIRSAPDIDSQEVGRCNSIDSVLLLRYSGGKYCHVALARNPAISGFLYIDFLKYDEMAVNTINDYNRRNGSSLKLTYTAPPKGYKSQQNKSIPSSTYTSPSSGHDIKTGPRGGRYYINKNGNKTYVKH